MTFNGLTILARRSVKTGIQNVLRSIGFELRRHNAQIQFHERDPLVDIDDATKALYEFVQPFTMTGIESVMALRMAVEYIVDNNITGDIVECGVWKGGSMMAVARTLIENGCQDRDLHLFDTFDGMTEPTAVDRDLIGREAGQLMDETIDVKTTVNIWAIASLTAVKTAMDSTGYDQAHIHYIKGRVEDTIPMSAPETIALLRLDTDWFESTYHEMVHLFPKLTKGGVVIIDDYGHWQGARLAIDKYVEENHVKLLLNRINYTARIGVKIE